MKPLLTISTSLAFFLISHLGAENACDEKAEMQRMAENYRKCAVENKSAKLNDCEESAPQAVKTAALKLVDSRQKTGALEEQLATAYEAGDKNLIQQFHKQKHDAELECGLFEKEKRAAQVISGVDELIQKIPDSAEAKQLKVKTEAELSAYLDNAKKMVELQKEQTRMEKGMETIDYRIEIIKKREELKKLEEEAARNR